MNRNTLLWVGVLGIGGYLVYRWLQQSIPKAQGVISTSVIPVSDASVLDARTTGLQAGIDAGTYNAAALRNQAFDDALIAQGGTSGIL